MSPRRGFNSYRPVVNQGLTTLATQRGPSGAKSFAMLADA
jgi:hypothetical protein